MKNRLQQHSWGARKISKGILGLGSMQGRWLCQQPGTIV
jgi:hypothetical protein